MAISPTESSATIVVGANGALSDGAENATLRVTVRDTSSPPQVVPHAQVHAQALAPAMIVTHEHTNLVSPVNPALRLSYTDAEGVAEVALGSVSGDTVNVSYNVYAAEDTPDTILYATNPALLAGRFGKPDGANGYSVGTIPSIPFTETFSTAQTIDEQWFIDHNAGLGRVVQNRIFAAGVTLAFTVDPQQECQFVNCVFVSSGNYALTTAGRTFRANNCGFRGSLLAALYGEGGTIVRSVFDGVGRDAVHIEQSGAPSAATAIPSAFIQCRFLRVSLTTAGYAMRGTPMRNVTVEHCWFDLASSTLCLGAVNQRTNAGGSRGPWLSGCWIEGGSEAQVSIKTGTFLPAAVPEFAQIRACRFDLGSATTYVEYDGVTVAGYVQGNMDDTTGELISSTAYPAANTTAGPLDMWPQVTLDEHPSVEWIGSSGGGTGGPGDPGSPPGTGSGSSLGTDVLYSVTEFFGAPAGGGAGPRVVRPTQITGTVLPADTPILLDGGVTPPGQPATVNWEIATSQVAEGATRIINAILTPAPGLGLDPNGYAVPVVATYASGATAAEFSIPATVDFGPGATIAQFEVQSIDDLDVEGAETLTLTLQPLSGLDSAGQTVVIVTPGTLSAHVMTVLASDAAGPVNVFFGTTAITTPEGTLIVAQNQYQVNVPISLSGNPTGQVQVSVAFTGTAVRQGVGSPFDYVVNTGTVYTFQPTTTGATPPDQVVNITIISDTIFEDPDETIILTLTSSTPTTATVVGGACTVTITDDDIDPGVPPEIGWLGNPAQTLVVAEATNTVVPLGTGLAGMVFPAFAYIRVQCIDQTATFGTSADYDLVLSSGAQPTYEATTGGEIIARIPIQAGQPNTAVTVRAQNNLDPPGVTEEQFLLRILDDPAYTVTPTKRDITVRILEPLSSGTDIFAERIPAGSQVPVQSLVSCTVPASATQVAGQVIPAPADGWNMVLNDGSSVPTDCQWYPVSYRPDGTPDAVHIWGLVPGAQPSLPGQGSSVRVSGGNPLTPTIPISLATQKTAVGANNLRLSMQHDINGESRLFELAITGNGLYSPLIDRSNSNLQGGGPQLFSRWRAAGQLGATTGSTTDPSLDKCTVARVYTDFRADMNAVLVTVNWGNYRWHKYANTDTDQHATANPYVDGEVFFKYLHLEGVPDGWAAVMADPRTTVTDFQGGDVGSNRVRIIKELGGDLRHYVPPLRGHIAYIVLYETATVSSAQATAVLNGYDRGYCSGPLGIDNSDVIGEHGTPACNYGEPANGVQFTDQDPAGGQPTYGWQASEAFIGRQAAHIETQVLAGSSDLFYGAVERGWWLPFGDSSAGAAGGNRIDLAGAVYPGKLKRRKNMRELVHLWQRVGMVPWNEKGESITDEDFCIEDTAGTYGPAGKPRCATAMWMGIGAQRMAHQHFYVPDYLGAGSGSVEAGAKLGPGRKRANGSITLLHPMQVGDTVQIGDGTNTWVFTFTSTDPVPADAGTTTYVLLGATESATNENLYRAILAKSNAGTLRIHPRLASDGTTLRIMHRFHGTVGNVPMVGGTRVTVVGPSGGLDTNTTAGVRPWNYIVPGSNRCNQDTYNDWHARSSTEDTFLTGVSDGAYHCWDWPHMSRMNEVTRDAWWLYFDPAAHDCIVGLGHLGTQCLTRYPEARGAASVWLTQGVAGQLGSACSANSLALALESHVGRYLQQFTRRGFNTDYSSLNQADFIARVDATGGLNVGTWIIRDPQIPAPPPYSPSGTAGTFNPQTALNYQFLEIAEGPIDRGWGWLMATVARMYAVDPAHRTTAEMNDGRDILHPPGSVPYNASQLKPSWFEVLREVIKNTMHASGAPASVDHGAEGLYTDWGPTDFATRTGSMPGGPQNVPTAGAGTLVDEEWYALEIAWHCHYVAIGAYSIMRRVYAWADSATQPATNQWLSDLLPLWTFGRLLLRSARVSQQAVHFFVPSFVPVATGTPSLTDRDAIYGRFNNVTGTANPNLTTNAAAMFWWNYPYPVPPAFGNHYLNFYAREYIMWCWMLWRISQLEGYEMVNDCPGLVAQGGGLMTTQALPMSGALMNSWNVERNQSAENVGDELGWAIQWLRNDFII
jgi:hypothetical protein